MPALFKQMSTWEETAQQMKDHRDATIAAIEPQLPQLAADLPLNVTSIPKQILTERELELTESTPEYLINALAAGFVTSTEVTKAFLRRAALAQQLVYLDHSHAFTV
jgi:hypothetical protein